MIITLKDGSSKEYAESKTVYEIAKDISEGLARAACAGELNGEVVDLRTVVSEDAALNILTASDPAGLSTIRHTASHVMAEAVKRLFPNAKLAIGPSIDTGFYYDFEAEPFSREDLDNIEKEMKKIIKEGHELKKFTLPRNEAIKFMEERNEPYKVELIRDLPEDAEISFYDQGGFVDLCAGPHLMTTKGIKAFKLTSSSMAYWRGDSEKARLQRIYGTAFNKKDELNEYLEYLAVTVTNLRMAYDCDIILGGYVGGYLEKYMAELSKRVIKYNGFEHKSQRYFACNRYLQYALNIP